MEASKLSNFSNIKNQNSLFLQPYFHNIQPAWRWLWKQGWAKCFHLCVSIDIKEYFPLHNPYRSILFGLMWFITTGWSVTTEHVDIRFLHSTEFFSFSSIILYYLLYWSFIKRISHLENQLYIHDNLHSWLGLILKKLALNKNQRSKQIDSPRKWATLSLWGETLSSN